MIPPIEGQGRRGARGATDALTDRNPNSAGVVASESIL